MFEDVVRYKKALLLSVMCLVFFVAGSASSTVTQLNLCYEETEIFPNFLGSGAEVASPDPGLIIEMLQLIDEQMAEIKIVYHRAAWNRCLRKLEHGEFNAVVAGFNRKRSEYASYPIKDGKPDKSRAISIADFCLFVGKNSNLSWDGERFVNTEYSTLAIPRGYSLMEILDRQEVTYEQTFSSQLSMELLIGGRVENVITLCSTGKAILAKHKASEVVKDIQVIRHQYGYVIVDKRFYQRHRPLVEALWQRSAKVREENYSTLLAKYDELSVQQ